MVYAGSPVPASSGAIEEGGGTSCNMGLLYPLGRGRQAGSMCPQVDGRPPGLSSPPGGEPGQQKVACDSPASCVQGEREGPRPRIRARGSPVVWVGPAASLPPRAGPALASHLAGLQIKLVEYWRVAEELSPPTDVHMNRAFVLETGGWEGEALQPNSLKFLLFQALPPHLKFPGTPACV